ncbi:M48 family metallopeptidase [Hellea balneolensis]|uniref:M48 family metallopeptidase n=1 Tax=Hellea balneolensis TaxID=287478 RepID=UPI00047B72BB|nr:M48 family metallopeptidase [Hellea balneolensis]
MCMNHCGTNETHEDKDMLARRNLVQALGAGAIITAAPGLTSCATNAETGRKQFLGLAPGNAQLNQMAGASWAEMKSKTPTSTDPRYTGRLRNIGSRISKGAGRGDQKWDYEVFDSDSKNAFVLPGNRVGFYKGMMDFADNDDQIAGIMGHEVGHVSGQHARERYSLQMASQAAVVGGAVIGGSTISRGCNKYQGTQRQQCLNSANQKTQYLVQALGLGTMIGLVLPYSRKHEAESDKLGVNYMHKAGYKTTESVRLWEKMAENSPSRQPTFLSTHPDPAWRARELDAYIRRQEKMGSQGFKNIQT